MQRVREEHSAHTCYRIPRIVSEPLQAQTADTHTPYSPTKETDSDAAPLSNRDNEACRTMVSWARNSQAARLLAEWPWPRCPISQQFSFPTSTKRQPAPSFRVLPLKKNWRLQLHARHTPSVKRGCQSCKLFSTCVFFDWKSEK